MGRDVTARHVADAALAESEARFRLLAENASDIITRTLPDGTIDFVSDAIRTVLGYEPEELLGRVGRELVSEADLPGVLAVAEGSLVDIPTTTRLRIRHKAGHLVWCEATSRVIRDDAGNPIARVSVTRDATAQVAAERALSGARDELAEAQRIAHVGSWTVNLATGERAWSPEALDIFGLEAGPNVGDRLREMLGSEIAAEMEAPIVGLQSGGAPVTHEFEVRRQDGSRRRLVARSEGVVGEHGDVVALRGTVADITDLRTAQDQVAQSERSRLVGQLAGGVAHDYNNILTAILGNAELLAIDLPVGSQQRADVEVIRESARRAADLTRRLLAYGRRQILVPRRLDAADVVRGILPLAQGVCGESISVSVSIPEPAPAVRADRTTVEQALLNLVVNARDAMPSGGGLAILVAAVTLEGDEPWLRATVPPGPYVRISVTDTGHGIEPEHLPRVFEPFYSTKEVAEGAGLGLASVDGTIAQSHGTVAIASEVGRGTTVSIYLPAAGDAAEPAAPEAVPGPAAKAVRILVADDAPTVRRTIARIARGAGHQVLEADGPEQALALAGDPASAIDVLLTDVVMPGMSGIEVAARLTAVQPSLRVVFMSGYSPDEAFPSGEVPAGSWFLPKPVTTAQLLAVLDEAIAARR